jgi:glycosyltransferase involved in cell wall biosynthesis
MPTFSLVLPIHNQATRIRSILDSVVDMTVGSYELLLIVDGCTDNTLEYVQSWCEELSRPPNMTHLEVIVNPPPGLFETSCDNQGFRMATGTYIVELQADMKILTFGYNLILASPLEQYPDLLGVSGRCCHRLNASPGMEVGKLGSTVERPHTVLHTFDGFGTIFLSHTVNRGPLVLRRSMLQELGYLDEEHFVLGNDDHDLFTRAWVLKQWRCGFVPVEVYSPLEWGSTRMPRSKEAQAYLDRRKASEGRGFLTQNQSRVVYPGPERRSFRIARNLLSDS